MSLIGSTDHVTQTMNYLLLCFLRPGSQWWLAYQTPKSYSTDMDLHCSSCLINFFPFRVVLRTLVGSENDTMAIFRDWERIDFDVHLKHSLIC